MSAWTDDRVKRLKRLWPEGHSATRIAADLGGGLTRNAVLAKVWRLGLSVGREVSVVRAPRRAAQPAVEATPSTPPRTGRASILSVRRHDCRWPYGDPLGPEFSLCGRPVSRGAYCGAHASIAYRCAPLTGESLLRWAGVA